MAKALSSGDPVVLGNYVRFENAPYAAGMLDQIIATERRDRAEFGFAQLRLVVCFLRWRMELGLASLLRRARRPVRS